MHTSVTAGRRFPKFVYFVIDGCLQLDHNTDHNVLKDTQLINFCILEGIAKKVANLWVTGNTVEVYKMISHHGMTFIIVSIYASR